MKQSLAKSLYSIVALAIVLVGLFGTAQLIEAQQCEDCENEVITENLIDTDIGCGPEWSPEMSFGMIVFEDGYRGVCDGPRTGAVTPNACVDGQEWWDCRLYEVISTCEPEYEGSCDEPVDTNDDCPFSGTYSWAPGCSASFSGTINHGDSQSFDNEATGYDGSTSWACNDGNLSNIAESCSADPVYGCTDSTADNYDSSATDDDGSCTYTVYGCTDSSADNYDSSANTDDGSCTYTTADPDPIYGCTDSSANNYNSSATNDDGSCTYSPTPVYGCTDSSADNYDSSANTDDGSCTYTTADPDPIYGCTDSSANNYNSSANIDDGSCTYSTADLDPVYGCTDSSADNYDSSATNDDGSCVYSPDPPTMSINADSEDQIIYIQRGEDVNIEWSAQASYPLECVVTGRGTTLDTFSLPNEDSSSYEGGTTSTNITSSTIFTLTCTDSNTNTIYRESVAVEVIPSFEEI